MCRLEQHSTRELMLELQTREGVTAITAEPHEDKAITVNGPAVILVVID